MKPMLAVNITPEAIRFPAYASAKLDGIRGLVIDGKLHSRSLKPIPNKHITRCLSRPELAGFDGEIIIGSPTAKNVCNVTTGGCARSEGTPDFKFFVFDKFDCPADFATRNAELARVLGRLHLHQLADFGCVELLPQLLVHNAAELLAFETVCLSQGFEGVILRDPVGSYKFGRSTEREQGMLKLKRFSDSEAVILDVVEEMENTNEKTTNELGRSARSSHQAGLVGKGRAGALVVRDDSTGQTFNIGGGFDAADREWFWSNRTQVVGKLVKYKSFLIGVKDAPRFPIYLGGREAWDL